MTKEIGFKNRDRLLELGIKIGLVRRMRGMSQEQLAERADISRTYLSMIEAPNTVCSFTLDVLYNIADALGMDAAELLKMKLPDITKSEQMQHGADD